jgi:apolipoprotein N-acyltransferase
MIPAALSAVLYAAAFSITPLWWVAFFSIAPLLLALDRSVSLKAAVGRMALFSIIVSCSMGYWILNALVVHYQISIPVAACFFLTAVIAPVLLIHLLTAFFYVFLNNHSLFFYTLVVPSLWVTGDYVKDMVNLLIPWGDLGYALVEWPVYFQIADLGSVRLVTFIVVMFNALLISRFSTKIEPGKPAAAPVILGIILILPVCYGYSRQYLSRAAINSGDPVPVTIVQGNYTPGDRWGGLGFFQRLKVYITLSAPAQAPNRPGIIVWPETVLNQPDALTDPFFASLAQGIDRGNVLLTGGLKQDRRGHGLYNSVYLVSTGLPQQRYDKHILLPYSERAPVIGPLFHYYNTPDRFIPGKTPGCLATPFGKAGVSICFEILYPGYIRHAVKQGATFLVNVSNDSWFGHSTMPYSHLKAARARAVETGRYLLRSSNSGFSAIIKPDGIPTATSSLFQAQQISGSFFSLRGRTIYTQWGEWVFMLSLAVLAVQVLWTGIRI